MTLLAQSTPGRRLESYELVPRPAPQAQALVLLEQGLFRRGLFTLGEPQDIRLKMNTVILPQTPFCRQQQERMTLGSGQHVVRSPELSVRSPPQKSILGQPGIEFGPVAELEYAKYLLAQEQTVTARAVLEHAIKRYPQEGRLRDLYRVIVPGRVERRAACYPNQQVEAAWIKTHRTQYHGKWVALFGEQVLAVGDNLYTVLNVLRDHHLNESPLIHHFD